MAANEEAPRARLEGDAERLKGTGGEARESGKWAPPPQTQHLVGHGPENHKM